MPHVDLSDPHRPVAPRAHQLAQERVCAARPHRRGGAPTRRQARARAVLDERATAVADARLLVAPVAMRRHDPPRVRAARRMSALARRLDSLERSALGAQRAGHLLLRRLAVRVAGAARFALVAVRRVDARRVVDAATPRLRQEAPNSSGYAQGPCMVNLIALIAHRRLRLAGCTRR